MKNSESFKSFEQSVGGAYESVKVRISLQIAQIFKFNRISNFNFRLKCPHQEVVQFRVSTTLLVLQITQLQHLQSTKRNRSLKHTSNSHKLIDCVHRSSDCFVITNACIVFLNSEIFFSNFHQY